MDASTSSQSLSFYDFLDRMRNPASLNLVRSIKRVQDFYLTMEDAIREHPLWTGATDEEIDRAMEGLEKYIMTKLFSRTFAASLEDAKIDQDISEKVCLLQTFLKPEHLDIPEILCNEASLLLAEKELQKINTFKAPREKLSSIMNCCRVINNLLLNAAMSENHVPAGADDFLPVLIYVTIKANPPQLESNLKFIQLYRRQVKLISEAAYYFTNLVSAKEFIIDLNAKSLSMDEIKFEESMQAAKLTSKVTSGSSPVTQMGQETQPDETELYLSRKIYDKHEDSQAMPIEESRYPYLEAESADLTVRDVDRLLSLYKDVVAKYTTLCRAISHLSTSEKGPLLRQLQLQGIGSSILASQPMDEIVYEDAAKETAQPMNGNDYEVAARETSQPTVENK